MVDALPALNAIKSSWGSLTPDELTSSTSVDAPQGGDFGTVMNHVITDAIGTLKAGEATAIQGLQGAAPAYKVVEAVMAAQRTLQETLALRDKAVSAYQQITQMPI